MAIKYIEVVAGIIFNADQSQVLLSLRKPDQHQGNRWEFPGGKIESFESIEQALCRELLEELGIQVTTAFPYLEIEHSYSDKAVRLHFWQVDSFTGAPVGREDQQLQWFDLAQLSELDFPEANQPIVTKLLEK